MNELGFHQHCLAYLFRKCIFSSQPGSINLNIGDISPDYSSLFPECPVVPSRLLRFQNGIHQTAQPSSRLLLVHPLLPRGLNLAMLTGEKLTQYGLCTPYLVHGVLEGANPP
jgi:hypothetical protein